MSIFRRAGRMVHAHADKAVGRMERPDLLISEAVRDAEADRRAVYKALHTSMSAKIMTTKQAAEQRRKAERLRSQADAYLTAGRVDLAEPAMRSALLGEYTADALDDAAIEMETQSVQLQESLAQLDAALEVIQALAIVEEARYQHAAGANAAAQARFGKADGSPSPFAELERARTKALQIASSAEATITIGATRPNATMGVIPDFGQAAKIELGIAAAVPAAELDPVRPTIAGEITPGEPDRQ